MPMHPPAEYLPPWRYSEWTTRPALAAVTAAAGDRTDDYDLQAAEITFLAAVRERMPDGFYLTGYGTIYGPARGGRRPLVEDYADDVDVRAILERHRRAAAR